MKIIIEKEEDFDAIRTLNDQAFQSPMEGKLIEQLRNSNAEIISLVAVDKSKIIGHILFSPVLIKSGQNQIAGMGLGPMSVLPKYQNQGIGSGLIKKGLKILRKKKCPFIIVLGHKEYYPKFGFQMASKFGIKCQWSGIPDEAFMALILDKSLRNAITGTAYYMDAFAQAL